jgi:hypothetical protein
MGEEIATFQKDEPKLVKQKKKRTKNKKHQSYSRHSIHTY